MSDAGQARPHPPCVLFIYGPSPRLITLIRNSSPPTSSSKTTKSQSIYYFLCAICFSLLAHWNSTNTPQHSSHRAQWHVSSDAGRGTQEPGASERPVMPSRNPSALGRQFSSEGAKKFELTAKELKSGSKGKDDAWPCSYLTEKRSGIKRHVVLTWRPVTCWRKFPASLFQ